MAQQKDDAGALFKNNKKESDKHPDYTGTAKIGGLIYRVSAWVNSYQTSNGDERKYMSLKFTPEDKTEKLESPPTPAVEGDDDTPF